MLYASVCLPCVPVWRMKRVERMSEDRGWGRQGQWQDPPAFHCRKRPRTICCRYLNVGRGLEQLLSYHPLRLRRCCMLCEHILVTAHNWRLRLHATNTSQPFSCKLRNVKNTVNNQSGREPTGLDWAKKNLLTTLHFNCKLDYYLAFSTSKACVSKTCMCACQAQYIFALYTHAAVKRHHVIPDTWLQTWQAMAEDWCFNLSTR